MSTVKKPAREELLAPLNGSKLSGKMRSEIAKMVIKGELDSEEAGRFLLAREVRRLAKESS